MESRPWAETKAVERVVDQPKRWTLNAPRHLNDVVRELMRTVLRDGGRRVGLHLGEQNRQILALVLSHQAGRESALDPVLSRLQELGVVSCGTEASTEGRQVWAVVDCSAR